MKKKAKQNVRLKGQLKLYMQWPAFMTILLIAMNIWIYRLDKRAGVLMLFFVLIYIAIVGIMYVYSKSLVMKDLVDFAAQYGIIQNTLLKKLAVPYALLLEDGRLMWMNDQFREILGSKLKGEAVLSRYIPELNRSISPGKRIRSWRWRFTTTTRSTGLNCGRCPWRASATPSAFWTCRRRRSTLSLSTCPM